MRRYYSFFFIGVDVLREIFFRYSFIFFFNFVGDLLFIRFFVRFWEYGNEGRVFFFKKRRVYWGEEVFEGIILVRFWW